MTSPADLWAAARAEVEDNLRRVEEVLELRSAYAFLVAVWRGYLGVLDRHRPGKTEVGLWCHRDGVRWPCPEVAAVLDSLRATGWQG